MQYIKVRWNHGRADSPVWLYSELDDERWETRKVEVFRDGSIGWASATEETLETRLGECAVPSLEEIASDHDGEFEPAEIDAAEFERVWLLRTTRWPTPLR